MVRIVHGMKSPVTFSTVCYSDTMFCLPMAGIPAVTVSDTKRSIVVVNAGVGCSLCALVGLQLLFAPL